MVVVMVVVVAEAAAEDEVCVSGDDLTAVGMRGAAPAAAARSGESGLAVAAGFQPPNRLEVSGAKPGATPGAAAAALGGNPIPGAVASPNGERPKVLISVTPAAPAAFEKELAGSTLRSASHVEWAVDGPDIAAAELDGDSEPSPASSSAASIAKA